MEPLSDAPDWSRANTKHANPLEREPQNCVGGIEFGATSQVLALIVLAIILGMFGCADQGPVDPRERIEQQLVQRCYAQRKSIATFTPNTHPAEIWFECRAKARRAMRGAF